jgi:riboflavin kinase/FMN adenylyltransferase
MENLAEVKISGTVIHGEKYGRLLGFPTANLDRRSYSRRKQNIKLGIYAGFAVINVVDGALQGLPLKSAIKGEYPAGVIVGPLDNHQLPKLEAHLIGFKGNLYGKKITLHLIKYLRPFKKFKSEKDLKEQIKTDIDKILNFKF